MLSPAIEQLIKIFAKFPTIGPKTAGRFVFYLLQSPIQTTDELIKSIQDLKNKTKTCPLCQRFFEPFDFAQGRVCEICANPMRDKSLVCIIEKEIDLETIEKTGTYKGLYFILNNNVERLIERIQNKAAFAEASAPKEIILAINPTIEGQNTILWLKRKLEGCSIKISCLAQGIPLGGELEYADEETISSALQNRR